MHREKLIFAGLSDLAGHFRGKSFPAAELERRAITGINMPPTNLMLSAFGPILATPFGTAGELALIPDLSTRVDVWFGEEDAGESFIIGDLRTPEGTLWECCPRNFLRRALTALQAEAGVTVTAAFEQEFYATPLPQTTATSYRLDSLRRSGLLGESLLGALRAAGLEPDGFMAEYAPGQFEVTVGPAQGLRAADDAVITREMIRAVAYRQGLRATLAPLLQPDGTGSGTHLHVSLQNEDGTAALYDPAAADELSALGAHFVAGMAQFLPAITALTAPSVPSYFRLRPNKWAPVMNDVAVRDRGTAIRICPSFSQDPAARARQYNVEFRVADATASPYLAMGAALWAGLEGIRRKLTLPVAPATLPHSLAAALELLAESAEAHKWMGGTLHHAYLTGKRAECADVQSLTDQEICDRYVACY